MDAVKKVAVIIVNYNAGELLSGNLQRIIDSAADGIVIRLFIVDNQSTDNSFEALCNTIATADLNETISLIQADKNGGFAYGNNVGMKAALASGFELDYFYFLNPDAVPSYQAITCLITESTKLQDNCILGSKMLNEDYSQAASAFRFPSVVSEFNRGAHLGVVTRLFKKSNLVMPLENEVTYCDWVCGASFLVPRNVFAKIGFMDDNYFLYYEEVDYMKKAKLQGIQVAVVASSSTVHIAGVSTGIVGGKAKTIPDYWYESWNRYFYKNHNAIIAATSGAAWLVGRVINNALSIFISSRLPKDGHSIKHFLTKALISIGKKR